MTDFSSLPDPYLALGVPRTATPEEVKRAYREAAKRLHPDRDPGAVAQERFARVVEAYQLLADPSLRAAYDASRGGEGPEVVVREAPPAKAGLGLLEGVTRVVGGVLEQVKEGVARRWSLGKDLRYTVSVSFREALLGCEKEIAFEAPVRCPSCQGRGPQDPGGARGPCATCGGEGVVVNPRRFALEIPPGTGSGQLTRIARGGVPGARGGPEGDLTFIVEVEPHPFLALEGDTLSARVPLPATTALGGGRLRVPTLEGSVVIEIPPGVQSGQVFRLPGQGAPRAGGQRGDLKITVDVEAPAVLPDEVRRLLQEAEQKAPAAMFPRSTALRRALEGQDE